MQQSALIIPFFSQVFLPIIFLSLIIRLISYFINQESTAQKVRLRLQDGRLILRIMAMPLLILLFFNFQNSLKDPNASLQASSSAQSRDPWQESYQRLQPQTRSSPKGNANPSLLGTVSPYLAIVLLTLASLSLLLLMQIRLCPQASLPLNFQPAALLHAIRSTSEGSFALGFLRLWHYIHIPLLMIVAMHFLPYLWHLYLQKATFIIAFALLLYSLWYTKRIFQIRHRYLECLLASGGDPAILRLSASLDRILHDQGSAISDLRILADQEYQERLHLLYRLLITATLFGYAIL